MAARRILITGVSSPLGGRLAQTLESDDDVEAIIGIDERAPRQELRRTEFVGVALARRPLERIIEAAGIDTVVDTRLIADSGRGSSAVGVEETESLLGACGGPGSPVRQLVFTSSALVYGWDAGQAAFLTEDMAGAPRPRTAVERAVRAAERSVLDFAARRPDHRVAILRFADEVGGAGRSSLLALLSLPIVPAVLGFDPRLCLVHREDSVAALAHAVRAGLDGAYNVAADGVLTLSEIASLLSRTLLPVLPPWGAGFAAGQLRRLGLPIEVEAVHQLRYGRGLDNRRLKASGFAYAYTAREAVIALRAEQRLRPLLGRGSEPYRYDPELEGFLRWSPSVRDGRRAAATAPVPAAAGASPVDHLAAGELVELITSLDPEGLAALREHELAHQRRPEVLEAIDGALARSGPA